MSSKAWLVQVPTDSQMPLIQFLDWSTEAAKSGFLLGINYVFYSNVPPPEFQMQKAFTIAFTTEGALHMDTFPMDLCFHLHLLENLMNPFWHDEDVFKKWYAENAKGFQTPDECFAFIKAIEKGKKHGTKK